MVAQKILKLKKLYKKSYNTSFTRRDALNMIFAQNIIYIFVPGISSSS
jgi:hypothetical protein